jgi:hypothetical protein
MPPLLLLLALAPAQKPNADEQRPAPAVQERRLDAVLQWNEIALNAIRRDKTAPPRAARALAILHIALADTANTIYQTHKPYKVSLRATEPMEPNVALAACAERVLVRLFPKQKATFEKAYKKAHGRAEAGKSRDRAVTLGRHVADRILTLRKNDGSDRAGDYRAEAKLGVWRPTPPDYTAAVLPGWTKVTPFGVKDVSDFKAEPLPKLTSKEWAIDCEEVRLVGGLKSTRRTADQAITAWFWNDGAGTCTPPGHWNQIAKEVSLDRGLNLHENARLFALLNIGLADAAIVCWDCKYRYRLWRPVTAIRRTEPGWTPLLKTPPFPSYTSGHSTFSGAAATILAEVIGEDGVEFTVGSDGVPGAERTYKGFWEAAREAGMSRIYGGIHYECDNREGLALGKRVAEEILRTRLLPLRDDPTKPRRKAPDSNTASAPRERP